MRKVRCYECKRSYNYDEDAFCPNCGAFNQPGRESLVRVGEITEEERKDGINEKNHFGSFLHREFHGEEKERREQGLDKGADRSKAFLGQAKKLVRPAGQTSGKRKTKNGKELSVGSIIFVVVIYILMLFFNIAA